MFRYWEVVVAVTFHGEGREVNCFACYVCAWKEERRYREGTINCCYLCAHIASKTYSYHTKLNVVRQKGSKYWKRKTVLERILFSKMLIYYLNNFYRDSRRENPIATKSKGWWSVLVLFMVIRRKLSFPFRNFYCFVLLLKDNHFCIFCQPSYIFVFSELLIIICVHEKCTQNSYPQIVFPYYGNVSSIIK